MKIVETEESCYGPSVRRLALEVLAATAIYCVSITAAMLWLRFGHPPAPWKYLIAVLPATTALLMPAAIGRYFRSLDEMWRKVFMDSFAFAFILSAFLALAYGLMEAAGLPRLSWSLVWTLMAVCWTIGLVVAYERYK